MYHFDGNNGIVWNELDRMVWYTTPKVWMEGLNTKGPLIKLSSRSINIDGDGRTQYQRTTNQAIEPINRQLFFFVDILSVQVTSYLGSRIRSRDKLWLIQVVIRFECDIKCSFPSASDRGIRVHLGLK